MTSKRVGKKSLSVVTTTKLQVLPNGAIISTSPRGLAGALSWRKGTVIQWKLEGKRLYVTEA